MLAQSEVTAFAEECGRELAAAEPIIKEAEAALNSLDKGSLGELKSFGSPAAEVVQVVSACIVLTAPGGKIPKVSTLCLSMPTSATLKSLCMHTVLQYVSKPHNFCPVYFVWLHVALCCSLPVNISTQAAVLATPHIIALLAHAGSDCT